MKSTSFFNGIINFLMRGVVGIILIYFVNEFLVAQGIILQVGMNVLTFLTSGMLGLPGVAMLYGMIFYLNL